MDPPAFQHLYSGLPQYGPGSNASTSEALRLVPDLPRTPTVFDLGCGGGRQTLELARQLKTKIVAVDLRQDYLDELAAAAGREGLSHLIETRRLSMADLGESEASIDLIWSEGAAYGIGVSRALELWRPMLSPAGTLAYTELTWLTDGPPASVSEYWAENYPDVTTVAANRLKMENAGYEVVHSFPLAADDWKAYYDPLRSRIEKLRARSLDWPELGAVIREAEKEIRIFDDFGDCYSYVFFIARAVGC